MAPEITLNQSHEHDKAVDWWSLVPKLKEIFFINLFIWQGVLIYELITGFPPFYGKDHQQLFRNKKDSEEVIYN